MRTEVQVALLAVTPNPVSTIYTACRQCYNPGWAWDMLETMELERDECPKDDEGIIYFEQQEKFIRDILASGHESPLEHVSFTFAIEGVSRSLTHQLVRHRIGVSYSQQSQRYVSETGEFDYILPKLIERDSEAAEIVEECFASIQTAYDKVYERMLELGYDKTKAAENARCVLPQATETKIVVTMNCRALLNFFSLRLCTRAQDEIREMAKLMHEWCVDELPCVFEGTGAKCEAHKRCPENPKFSCGKYPQFEK